jgi:hypothetical protein
MLHQVAEPQSRMWMRRSGVNWDDVLAQKGSKCPDT